MKKFCNKCGNQLDLSHKSCTVCQAFNPYFIAGFTNTTPLEPAIQIEARKEEKAELENLRQQQLEQLISEQELKNELQKVKEEAEQYKKQTFDLVKEVQKELHDIEAENKLLNEKVELLKTNTPHLTIPHITEYKNESKKGVTAIAAVLLLMVATGASYFFFNTTGKSAATGNSNTNVTVKPATTEVESKKTEIKEVPANSTVPVKKLLAVVSVPPAAATTAPVVSAPVATKKTSPESFSLTESKLKGDLVGKKLSGCDITINNSSEISHIGNMVLVEKLSASYLKYKCTLNVKQGTDSYTSTPYIYYSADGTFIKIDGTNCE